MTGPRSPQEWGDVYSDLRPTYIAFSEKLEALVETLLDDAEARYASIRSWTPNRDFFVERIYRTQRAGTSVDDPLADWNDLAGVSIIVYATDDFDDILSVIASEFDVVEDASLSVSDALAAGERLTQTHEGLPHTGYAFPYLVVTLSEPRSSLTEWRPYEGLRVRIDVQTHLQKAWERLDDYELPYHWDASYPDAVRLALEDTVRKLIAADEAIVQIRRELERADELYDDAIAAGTLDLELNARSLAAYLRAGETVLDLVAIAERVGMTRDENEAGTWEIEQILLWLLAKLRIASIADLDAYLIGSLDRAERIFADLTRISGERGDVPWAGRGSVVVLLLLVLMRADSETVGLYDFRDEIEYAVNTLIGNPVAETSAD